MQLQKEVRLRSAEITSARIATAHRLEPLIMGHMDRLGMPHAKFIVRISPKQNSDGIFSCTANGSAAVAAKADHRLLVEKKSVSGRTATIIREVTGEQRIEELARMLSGTTHEHAALEHVRILVGSR